MSDPQQYISLLRLALRIAGVKENYKELYEILETLNINQLLVLIKNLPNFDKSNFKKILKDFIISSISEFNNFNNLYDASGIINYNVRYDKKPLVQYINHKTKNTLISTNIDRNHNIYNNDKSKMPLNVNKKTKTSEWWFFGISKYKEEEDWFLWKADDNNMPIGWMDVDRGWLKAYKNSKVEHRFNYVTNEWEHRIFNKKKNMYENISRKKFINIITTV